ncbi:ABC transporter permease [Anaerocolumna sp.]|uniref:ABC transporter permease n=1 Tax=Anaerocolumna sp. TaxID=2041569 RepID=UPI0028AD0487|nr:ABC transporter permease [Anaerocolumna sp.]
MGKLKNLIKYNFKSETTQYISYGIIIFLTAFILNIAFVLTFQVENAYEDRFIELETANYNFCIPAVQDEDILEDKCLEISGVEEVEKLDGIKVSSIVKDFRGTDFTMNVIFYNLDEDRKLNLLEIQEEDDKSDFENPIYVPEYYIQFGQYSVGDTICFEIGDDEYDFQIAGVINEMQYGNYGTGLIGLYLPDEVYQDTLENLETYKVVEYSLRTTEQTDKIKIKNKINDLLEEENITLLSLSSSEDGKQARMMVCKLTISILVAFAFIILLVSIFLCKFKIQNTIEEKIASMGVLKALGYTGGMIIQSMVFPYLAIVTLVTIISVAASYTVIPTLSNMLALQSGFSFNLKFDINAFLTVLIVLEISTLAFVLFSARRIRKLQPITAIRGTTGSIKGKKNHLPLDETPGNLKFNIILKNTILSAQHNVLLFSVSFLVMVLMAFASTLLYNVIVKPDNFMTTLLEETPDVVLQTNEESVRMGLKKDAQVEKVLEYSMQNVKISENSITAFVCDDFSRVSNDLCYKGRNPNDETEIAIGNIFEENYEIGDKIEISHGDVVVSYIIVGFIQGVNYQGSVCELTNEGYKRIEKDYQANSLYVYLKDEVDQEGFIERIESEQNDKIISSVNYAKNMEISQSMYSKLVILIVAVIFALTILIVLLILYVIIRSQITQRKHEFGIYKAIGYSNNQLTLQLAFSFLPVSVISILISAGLGILYMPVINQALFEIIGAEKNNFEILVPVLFLFALLQIVINFVISIGLSMPIKKISAYSLIKE